MNIALESPRFGAIGVRAPVLVLDPVAALVALAIVGIQRIAIDDSLSQLFRADTPEFRQFEQISGTFPSSEYDVLVVVEGKALLERDTVENLRRAGHRPATGRGRARGDLRCFRRASRRENGGLPTPLFPDPLPEGASLPGSHRQAS